MQKPTQKEPSWSLLNIPFHHLFFPFFLLCPFASMFSWRTKTCIILFHKPFVDFQKIYNGWVFKTVIQSLFFIHLWCLNVAKHYMMPWSYCKLFFFILLSGVELFLISETEILRKSLELKVRYSRITLLSVHLCFWSWDCRVSIRAERWLLINCLLRIFILWSGPYLTDALLFFLKKSCQRMMVQKLSPRRGSIISGLKKFLSKVCSGALKYSSRFKILLWN